ncbi:MAG: adenosine kinase [Bacteroidetes bacterium HGW-Bacteroidetes-6]|jgi:sugar/nucleoside kinase (ribokinase family)|nr:MAG: adenosine kinase [Bacteroidetes bacterium HGW-Bacteroidetes-6]
MKIIGIGNALTDLMTQIDTDEILEMLKLPKGSMQLVDSTTSKNASEVTKNFKQSIASGGSAANTIHGLARLGIEAGFIGKTGTDDIGLFFENDMRKAGIKTYLIHSKTPSGLALALVSPDGERTFATYLGAAVELTASDIDKNILSQYDILHIEGYLLQNYELISHSIELAKELGLLVSLDLASYNVVEENINFLNEIVATYVDIVFANEEESKAFTGMDPEESVKHLGKIVDIAVVKTGPHGSFVSMNGEVVHIPTTRIVPIDTTGAGDLYAAGFLYGLATGKTPFECGEMGTKLASEVICHIGAKIPNEKWSSFRQL